MIDPATGAWTCASGNQVWNGNIGTLIANASANARNIHGPQFFSVNAKGERFAQWPLAAQAPSSWFAWRSEL